VINVYNVYKKILCKRVYYFVHVYLNKKLEEISYSETTVPWFEQREFISDSDSDEDNSGQDNST